MDDVALARRHAPVVYFDGCEPFVPQMVGYTVLRAPGPSPSHGRYVSLTVPDGRRAAAVIEYALWTDWDIQHLYELEHVWSYVDADGRLLHAEASWHGGAGPLVQDGRLSAEDERPIAYAQPGKHAMAPTPELFHRFDLTRDRYARACWQDAGNDGLLVGQPIAGQLERTRRADGLANGFLRRRAFQPTFRFDRRWDARDVPLIALPELIEQIPGRLRQILDELETARSRRPLWAVLFDLGDTLMSEITEEKDGSRTTQRAELFVGVPEMVWTLRRAGYLIGLVADTRPGTYRNVLRQHDLYGAFDVFAISEEIGCEKPDPRMFQHALEGLGLLPAEAGRVAMVGNNLARDIRGANAAGMISIWLRFNERYPLTPTDDAERPRYSATSCAELLDVIGAIERGGG